MNKDKNMIMTTEEAIKILTPDTLFKIQKDTSLAIRIAIETVVQELKNSIPKKKIEDKIKYWEKLMDNYCKGKEYDQVDIATYKIKVLQELLEDK